MFGPVSAAYEILSFHHAHGLAQGLEGARSESRYANLPADAARREADHAFNEKMRTQKERRQAPSTAKERRSIGRIPPLNLGPQVRRKRRER
jgi:hypothetical protein